MADWAWNARHALGLRNTETVAQLLATSVDPAHLRKVETGGMVSAELWDELGALYRRLAEERGSDLPAQPPHPATDPAKPPTEITLIRSIDEQSQAIRALADQVKALAEAQISPGDLAHALGEAVRLAVREAVRRASHDDAPQRS